MCLPDLLDLFSSSPYFLKKLTGTASWKPEIHHIQHVPNRTHCLSPSAHSSAEFSLSEMALPVTHIRNLAVGPASSSFSSYILADPRALSWAREARSQGPVGCLTSPPTPPLVPTPLAPGAAKGWGGFAGGFISLACSECLGLDGGQLGGESWLQRTSTTHVGRTPGSC